MAEQRDYDLEPLDTAGARTEQGGFVALAVIAAAIGAGAAILLAPNTGAETRRRVTEGLRSLGGEAASSIAQLQRDIRRRRDQSRREKRIMALAGVLVGATLTAVLTPESGSATRQRLKGTLGRIKVGAIDRIDRLQRRGEEGAPESVNPRPVRSVQELGRDPNSVF